MDWIVREKGGRIFISLLITAAVMTGLGRVLPAWFLDPAWLGTVSVGLFLLLVGLLARLCPPRLELERQTGRELVRRPVHTVFWIRVEYLGVLIIALGILFALGILLQSIPAPTAVR